MYLIEKEKRVNRAYNDCFLTLSSEVDEFLECLEERGDNSEWKSIKTSGTLVIDAKDDDNFLRLKKYNVLEEEILIYSKESLLEILNSSDQKRDIELFELSLPREFSLLLKRGCKIKCVSY